MGLSAQAFGKVLGGRRSRLQYSIHRANGAGSNSLQSGASSQSGASKSDRSAGFTLVETLVVAVAIGVLAASAVPGWSAFWQRQKLTVVQGQVYDILRQAQATAKLKHLKQQVSFRNQGDQIEWVIHPTTVNPTTLITWQRLEPGVQVDSESRPQPASGIYRIQFNHQGDVNGSLGRITVSMVNTPLPKRCVFISTLLGAMRTGESRAKPDSNGMWCY
jgi:prepilin-type N-terminal cleavage/methylation domain-containing protein